MVKRFNNTYYSIKYIVSDHIILVELVNFFRRMAFVRFALSSFSYDLLNAEIIISIW